MRSDDPLPSTIDQVRRHLVGLKMPRALEVLDHTMRQLERGEIGALEAIDALLGEELTLREGRRVKAALKMGRLVSIKTLAQIDRNELAQLGCDLTSIPSPTGQEKAVADFILSWFEANGLKAVRQDVGVWQCTAGPSYWVQEENEFVHVLSGSLTVTPDGGSSRKLGPGDTAVFPRGWRGRWDLHETVRKVYVIF